MAKGYQTHNIPEDVCQLLEQIGLESVNGKHVIAPKIPKIIEMLAREKVSGK